MTHPEPIDPASINTVPLQGMDLPLRHATNNRIVSADELFRRLFAAESAVAKQKAADEFPWASAALPADPKTATPRASKPPPAAPEQPVTAIDSTTAAAPAAPKVAPTVVNFRPAPPPTMRPLRDVFNDIPETLLGPYGRLEIPTWPEGARHFPHVPAVDPHYTMNTGTAPADMALALATGENIMIVGPTGSGKSTLVRQAAARTGRPFFRVNFDSEMRRPELLGHHMQRTTPNGSFIEWQPGILQHALAHPSLICFDEYDRADPDLVYAIHELLEGGHQRVPEEGDMTILRHPLLRIAATANTKGAGESMGVYADDTRQSEASRNRFGYWSEHGYMSTEAEALLLRRHYPGSAKFNMNRAIAEIATEIRNNFIKGDVGSSCSPRQTLRMASDIALGLSLLDKPSQSDADNLLAASCERVLIGRATDTVQAKKIFTIITNKTGSRPVLRNAG